MKDKRELLKNNLPFFNKLTELEISNLLLASQIRKFSKGELLHNNDDRCTGVVIVLDGLLRSFMSSKSGKEITLFRLYDRDICILSASCVYQNLAYDVSLEAEVDTEVILIGSGFFKDLSSSNIDIQTFVLNLTQDKLSELLWVIEQVVFLSLDTRLANFLVNESNFNDTLRLSITHDFIANNLGSAREVISRMLKRFEKDGMVKLSRGVVEITDIKKLRELV